MSAYLCDDDTFDLIASAAAIYGRHSNGHRIEPHDGQPDFPGLVAAKIVQPFESFCFHDRETVARVLRAENVRSLQGRYPRDWQAMVGEAAYRFAPVNMDWDKAAPIVLKSLACLRYQSCECDDYQQTLAFQLLERIEGLVIRAIPGYEDAPWGWTREKAVTA